MFYIEVSKRFLADDGDLARTLSDYSKGSEEKEFSVVYLTDHEREMVSILRERGVAFTISDREKETTGAPDTY